MYDIVRQKRLVNITNITTDDIAQLDEAGLNMEIQRYLAARRNLRSRKMSKKRRKELIDGGTSKYNVKQQVTSHNKSQHTKEFRMKSVSLRHPATSDANKYMERRGKKLKL